MALAFCSGSLTEAIIRHDWARLDPDALGLLSYLHRSPAALVWHKCGTFEDHLIGVWACLCAWKQPLPCTRLGLFHSAYGNSFVAMRIFDASTERPALAGIIGEHAERLVHQFCSVDRQRLENMVLDEGTLRAEGYDLQDIRTGEALHVTQADAADMVVETVADFAEQSFGWQSDLEDFSSTATTTTTSSSSSSSSPSSSSPSSGDTVGAALWPGDMRPTLRMSRCSRFAAAARASGALEGRVPPVFNHCSEVLDPSDEGEARDLYWRALTSTTSSGLAREEWLQRASRLNPYVGEPHILRAQLLLARGEWVEAAKAAKAGLEPLEVWATAWDKRMPWSAWVNWARVLGLQASARQWPAGHGGLESLGATEEYMQFRELNDGRELLSPGKAAQQTTSKAKL